MRNRSLVTDYVNRSKSRVKAVETLMAEKSYADVVRESQEVIELLCKALVRHLGAEPARVHDVGTQLNELKDRTALLLSSSTRGSLLTQSKFFSGESTLQGLNHHFA